MLIFITSNVCIYKNASLKARCDSDGLGVVNSTYDEIFVDPRWFNVEVNPTAISSVPVPKSSSNRRVNIQCFMFVFLKLLRQIMAAFEI
jgi:hypothetical protein